MKFFRPRPALPADIGQAGASGYVDTLEGAPLPLLRAIGWFGGDALPEMSLQLAGRRLAPLATARMPRPDVVASGQSTDPFTGFRVDFLFDAGERPVELQVGTRRIPVPEPEAYAALDPHYRGLFTEQKVLGRRSIYGSGPPVDVSMEFKQFIGCFVSGQVLDFGCGNGDLVAWLRQRGDGAEGLELDEPRIRDGLKPEAALHVRLYAGSDRLPFDDGRFDAIASTEVIEHIPDVHCYVDELARVLRPGGRLVLTTPDITSIPSLFPAGVVPWHLLESTHINFFTPASVQALFAPRFTPVGMYCLGSMRVGGLFAPGSIGAVFERR